MQRFEFRLERLLKVKRDLERLAEMEQRRAAMLVRKAEQQLAELHQQMKQLVEATNAKVGSLIDPNQWIAMAEFSEVLARSIVTAEKDVERAKSLLAVAEQERKEISTDVEALKVLREQKWEKWKAEYQKAEQDQLNELGLRMATVAESEDEASVLQFEAA